MLLLLCFPMRSALEIAKMKPVLLRGIECLRAAGNHGLEISLLVKLAQYFFGQVNNARYLRQGGLNK